ncbi:DUF3232 domain-containing protein [Candidatus Parcubacteria bacterium]|nr:MAG: DUF3232 domain-containing protein [Candidatus Parcubacteria bacterium]
MIYNYNIEVKTFMNPESGSAPREIKENAVFEANHDLTLREADQVSEQPVVAETMPRGHLSSLREHILHLPEYENYKNQPIKLENFDSVLEEFWKHVGQSPKPEEVKTGEVLDSLVKGIRGGVSDYYKSLLSLQRVGKKEFLVDREAYKEETQYRDQRRKIVHDALISDLKAFHRYCYQVLPKKFGISVATENFFKGPELNNRDFIGNWAFETEQGRRLEDAVRVIDSKLSGKKEEAESTH